MNLMNLTSAMIGVLIYEMVLTLSHTFFPALYEISFIISVTVLLRLLSGIILVLFMYRFFQEEKGDIRIGQLLKLILYCAVAAVILSLPVFGSHVWVRISRQSLTLALSVLFLMFAFAYRTRIPNAQHYLIGASTIVSITFGIRVFMNILALFDITRYALTGLTTDYSQSFYNFMLILFLAMHASIIYFLFRYYEFKFGNIK